MMTTSTYRNKQATPSSELSELLVDVYDRRIVVPWFPSPSRIYRKALYRSVVEVCFVFKNVVLNLDDRVVFAHNNAIMGG